jgi:hypothetical protein
MFYKEILAIGKCVIFGLVFILLSSMSISYEAALWVVGVRFCVSGYLMCV